MIADCICRKVKQFSSSAPKLREDGDLISRTTGDNLPPTETVLEGAENIKAETAVDRVTARTISQIEVRLSNDGTDADNRVGPSITGDALLSTSDEDSRQEDIVDEDEDDKEETDSSQHSSEASMKEEDIEELIGQLVETEMEAAKVQESLEDESLSRVRTEVTAEFSETHTVGKVESAVEEEMGAFVEHCNYLLGEIEEKSALLQEKLEDAGVSLTHLFKFIERQISEQSTTEAWKKRTLWVGNQPTEEVASIIGKASEELRLKHPTRSHRGKTLDEGASGFLRRKLASNGKDITTNRTSEPESSDDDAWSKLEESLDNDEKEGPGQLMGTKRWASVYLASTPEQAAQLGFTLPGADIVEEIGDTESDKGAIFRAALKNERERGLTEGQKKSIKKVREEDDLKKIRKRSRRSRHKNLKLRRALSEKASRLHVLRNGTPFPGQLCPQRKSEHLRDVINLLSDDEDSEIAGTGQAASARVSTRNDLALQENIQVEPETDGGREDSRGPIGGRPEIDCNGGSSPKDERDSPFRLQELDKKRTFQRRPGDTEEEHSAKKLRTDSVHQERTSRPGGFNLESKQSLAETRNSMHGVRKTVVIDSDGEREIEETLTGPQELSESPIYHGANSREEVVRSMMTEHEDHEDLTTDCGDGVSVEQGMSTAEPAKKQLTGRTMNVRVVSDMRVKYTSCTKVLEIHEMVRHPNPRLGGRPEIDCNCGSSPKDERDSPFRLQELDKKRTFQRRPGDTEEEHSAKKLRTDSIHQERRSCPGGFNLESKQSLAETRNRMHGVRKTVVIDSDGEREIEETLTGPQELSESPIYHGANSREEVVHSMMTEHEDHEDLTTDCGDGVSVEQGMSTAEPAEKQLTGRTMNVRVVSDMRVKCTSCTKVLEIHEMVRHPNPRLPVAVCRCCMKHYSGCQISKDKDGSDFECSWCGIGGRVVCCTHCDKVFCQLCIVRNFGAKELLRIVTDDYWLCFFCNGTPLTTLTVDLERAECELERLLASCGLGDVDDLTNWGEALVRHPKKGKHRRNIRKMFSDDELEEKHKELLAREKERQYRPERWHSDSLIPQQHLLAAKEQSPPDVKRTDKAAEEFTLKGLSINAARDSVEEAIFIAPSFSQILRPHQIQGVRFMWENCIESVKKVRSDPDGVGCILAHSMRLGKTLQVITFLHTVLMSDILKTALIVVPVNVLHNWKREFDTWQESLSNPVPVYILEDIIRENTRRAQLLRENTRRAQLLSRWRNGGGVMLIGYSVFQNLCIGKHV
ncbi:hypothetical protein R1sor_008854 [Riccia sorocarpa]|uniref:PHD-type domain-containing protein n=1 Tax=Riccia sorocarpa TaxID=122646 RepID=A0ABD3H447_9MARC